MIATYGDMIRRKIIPRIHEAGLFTVIADEATELANDEQLSMSVGYLENGLPNKRFIGLCECQEGVSGEAIANVLLDCLTEWELNPQLL